MSEAVIEVRNEPDRGAFVISADGEEVGHTEYLMRSGRFVFVHTEVDSGHSGSGLGNELVRRALDDVRSKRGQIVPLCPFVAAYLTRHPEYEDLVDKEMTERYRAKRG